ncbi:MAG: DUF3857 domain-containing protein [Bacteroidales bacterium]|nr:DUF3857 domain-containing protein [Bacteroidales bacterium]
MKLSVFFSLSLIVALSANEIKAQKEPIKFGKIDKADLEMTVYDKDSTAPAVILCDYGYWSLQDYKFRRIVRYKVLTADGLRYADTWFPGSETTAVRGRTYNLENGEVVETKLKNENVFKERITEDYYRLRIAMPDVKIGSVFDIEFTSPFIINEWKFQCEIPVKYSELIVPQSQYIDFKKNFFGYERLAYSGSERWIATNMPAFKEEPYTSSIENYITKFEFDLLSVHFPGLYKEFTTDWDAVARRLEESSYFGGTLSAALYLNSLASRIKDSCTTDYDKMKAACEAVGSAIKWNEVSNLSPTYTSLGTILREGSGNSADVNLILVNLLRKLDISAYPVVLSTRDNGVLPVFGASMNKLNYILAYAKIGETTYLLDATEPLLPAGMLPIRCLNGHGRIMYKETSTQVSLKADKKDKNTKLYDLELTGDLLLKGSCSTLRNDYGAYYFRKYYKSFNSADELVEDIEDENPGLEILNYKAENIDSIYSPIREKYDVEIRNQVYEIDGQVFVNPLLFNQIKENPFKPEERKYPVDYAHCIDNSIIIKIAVPEGYEVAHVPAPVKMELPDNGGRFVYQAAVINNALNISYKFSINKEMFLFSEYAYLKEFYNQIIKAHAEPVILNKL